MIFGTLLNRDSFTRCRQFKWHKVHLSTLIAISGARTASHRLSVLLLVDKIISKYTAYRYTVRMLNDILLNLIRKSRSRQWTWANLLNKNIAYNLLSIILRMLWEWDFRTVAPHKKNLKKYFANGVAVSHELCQRCIPMIIMCSGKIIYLSVQNSYALENKRPTI